MGREIEIKVPLSKEEFLNVYSVIYGRKIIPNISCKNVELIFKQDQYFSKYKTRELRLENKEPQVIRLRTEEVFEPDIYMDLFKIDFASICDYFKSFRKLNTNPKSFFTLKFKNKENGIELNKEDETFIQDPSVLIEFFQIAGYQRWFNKEKCAWSTYCYSHILENIPFHLELEAVNNLLYLEVEVTEPEIDAFLIKEKIAQFIQLLDINPENRDSRSWVEILQK